MDYIAGLVKLLLIDIFAIFFVSSFAGNLAQAYGARGCPAGTPMSVVAWLTLPLALLCIYYIGQRMLRPAVVTEAYRSKMRVGPVDVVNPVLGTHEYPFLSSHPSYALVDVLAVGLAYGLYRLGPWSVGCDLLFEFVRGRAALAFAVVLPVARLLCWYALGRRGEPPAPAEVQAKARRGVLLFHSTFTTITIAVVSLAWWQVSHDDPKVIRLKAQDFAGGLAAHSQLLGKEVKLTGTTLRPHATRCECGGRGGNNCHLTVVLVDLGAGGEAIFMAGDSNGDDLAVAAEGQGRKVTHSGTLMRPDQNPLAQKHPVCADLRLGPPPLTGRVLVY